MWASRSETAALEIGRRKNPQSTADQKAQLEKFDKDMRECVKYYKCEFEESVWHTRERGCNILTKIFWRSWSSGLRSEATRVTPQNWSKSSRV